MCKFTFDYRNDYSFYELYLINKKDEKNLISFRH